MYAICLAETKIWQFLLANVNVLVMILISLSEIIDLVILILLGVKPIFHWIRKSTWPMGEFCVGDLTPP